MSGSNAIRGTRVGAGPMGAIPAGMVEAARVQVSYWCANGHETQRYFAASIPESEIPATMDCPNCGGLSGTDQDRPPEETKVEPYKTHLAYVKERRTPDEAEALLQEALDALRARRARALAAMSENDQ